MSPAKSHIVTVDPGLSGTGFAVWVPKTWKLMLHGSITPTNANAKTPVAMRAWDLGRKLCNLLAPYEPSELFFEMPASWGGVSDKSQAVVKLALTAGVISGYVSSRFGCKLCAIPVADWKGQLPGDICCKRVAEKMGWNVKDYTDHDLDAVGIGLFLQGKF